MVLFTHVISPTHHAQQGKFSLSVRDEALSVCFSNLRDLFMCIICIFLLRETRQGVYFVYTCIAVVVVAVEGGGGGGSGVYARVSVCVCVCVRACVRLCVCLCGVYACGRTCG
jgi:hypothetical protein